MGENMKEELAELLAPFKGQKGALIPILQKVQEKLGYLPREAMIEIADFLGKQPSEVYGVATFYAQFRLKPTGKNIVRVCRGTACHVKGGDGILKEVRHRLGVEDGETTPDLEYTLETIACIGACGLAPTMVINNDTFGQMTAKKVEQVFSGKSSE